MDDLYLHFLDLLPAAIPDDMEKFIQAINAEKNEA